MVKKEGIKKKGQKKAGMESTILGKEGRMDGRMAGRMEGMKGTEERKQQ